MNLKVEQYLALSSLAYQVIPNSLLDDASKQTLEEIVSHLINGLPGETHEMMLENVRRCVTDNDIQGIKLHLLHLMTNTRMQRDYHEGRLQLLSQEEYVSIVCDQLEIIPEHIVIHRITGDAPRDMLIGPMWSLNKWEVLNAIEAEMRRRGSKQGCKAKEQRFVC